jgi:hypothetical protein
LSILRTGPDRLARLDDERWKLIGTVLSEETLKDRFPDEATSWDAVKDRCRKGGGVLADEFRTFSGFLRSIGLRPSDRHSVDRINPRDPVYGPGKVRWATPRMQTANRTNSRVAVCPLTGRVWTFAALSALHGPGFSEKQLYRFRKAGWSDAELIAGYQCPTLARLGEHTAQAAPASSKPATAEARKSPPIDIPWLLGEVFSSKTLAQLRSWSPWPSSHRMEAQYRARGGDYGRIEYLAQVIRARLNRLDCDPLYDRWERHEHGNPTAEERRKYYDDVAFDDRWRPVARQLEAKAREWRRAVEEKMPQRRPSYDYDEDDD